MVFFIGVITSIKLFLKNDIKNNIGGAILISISLMQLVEYFIWLAIEKKNKKMNNIATIFVDIILVIQIISALVANHLLVKDKDVFITIETLGIIYFISVIWLWYKLWPKMNKIFSFPDKNTCRLNWGFSNITFKNFPITVLIKAISYILILVLVVSYIFDTTGLIILVGTLLASMFYGFFIAKKLSKTSFGSIWCFSILVCFAVVNLFDDCPAVEN